MKRYDPRLWIGILMVFGGILILLENLNIISEVGEVFWGVVWGLVGFFFLYTLLRDRANWWAAFPAFTLLGLSASALVPNALEAYDSLILFAGISLAFWWVYFTDSSRWWAIIPAGVMLTLGVLSVLDDVSGIDNGGFLFLGIGITFILVAILPSKGGGRSWAFIPGAVLLIFGSIIGTSAVALLDYLWPAVLIVLGGYFVLRFFKNQSPQ